MTYWSGNFDMHQIDTTPGAAGPFAPPSGWTGGREEYRALLRERYGRDVAARQQMGVVAMRLRLVSFSGPWAEEAIDIVGAIGGSKKVAA